MRELFLRLTWPGEVADDYLVMDDGQKVGRIRLATERTPAAWNWHINIHDPSATRNGNAPTLDAAKSEFKTTWFEVRPNPFHAV